MPGTAPSTAGEPAVALEVPLLLLVPHLGAELQERRAGCLRHDRGPDIERTRDVAILVVLKTSVSHALRVAIAGLLEDGFGWMLPGSIDDGDTFGANVIFDWRKMVSRRSGWSSSECAHETR